MTIPRENAKEVAKANLLSINQLAFILNVDAGQLVDVARRVDRYYDPFETAGRSRPFQKQPPKTRLIDNPLRDLKRIQKRIYRRILRPICFPNHILGGVPKRSVLDNAERHRGATLLVTLDIRKCFPSITNKHVYHVWRGVLGCSPRVASLLTRLTTFKRRLPQGSPASPLIANLLIWAVDEPIRKACAAKGVIYSTWIDDLAFSGDSSREMIQLAASVLGKYGLRISRKKIKIMGPRAAKLLTGTRLGKLQARASRDKIARVRSGIHKLRTGVIAEMERGGFVDGLIGQLRYIEQLAPKDALRYVQQLSDCSAGFQSTNATSFFRKRVRPSLSPASRKACPS